MRAGVQGRRATAARIKSERSERLYAALHLPGECPRPRSRTLSASTWGGGSRRPQWPVVLPRAARRLESAGGAFPDQGLASLPWPPPAARPAGAGRGPAAAGAPGPLRACGAGIVPPGLGDGVLSKCCRIAATAQRVAFRDPAWVRLEHATGHGRAMRGSRAAGSELGTVCLAR